MNLLKNYLYNLMVLFLQIGAPLITIPYVSRIFAPETMGTGVYAASIAKWLVVFSQLGIATYGIRLISSSANKLRLKRFWQLYFLNGSATLFFSLLYLLWALFFAEDQRLYLVQGLLLFLNFFEIGWYFSGIQNFKAGLYRSLLTKGLSIVLILTLIKTVDDFYLFLFIQSGSLFLGAFFQFRVGPSLSSFKKNYLRRRELGYHLSKTRSFLYLAIFINLYTVFDKILVGNLGDAYQLGLYEMTFRIILTLMVFSVSAGGILLPKSSELMAQNQQNSWGLFIKAGFIWAFFSSFLISSFLMFFYREFVLFFLGEKYLEIQKLMLFAPLLILLLSINNVTSQQILIPSKKEKVLNKIIWLSATVSVLVNLGLVPVLGAAGALMSWTATEFIGTLLQLFHSRAYFKLGKLLWVALGWIFSILGFALLEQQSVFKLSLVLKVGLWISCMVLAGFFVLQKLLEYKHSIQLERKT